MKNLILTSSIILQVLIGCNITNQNENTAPVFHDVNRNTFVFIGDKIKPQIFNKYTLDNDDNDELTFTILEGLPNSRFINDTLIYPIPTINDTGIHTVKIKCSDGKGGIDTASWKIFIYDKNAVHESINSYLKIGTSMTYSLFYRTNRLLGPDNITYNRETTCTTNIVIKAFSNINDSIRLSYKYYNSGIISNDYYESSDLNDTTYSFTEEKDITISLKDSLIYCLTDSVLALQYLPFFALPNKSASKYNIANYDHKNCLISYSFNRDYGDYYEYTGLEYYGIIFCTRTRYDIHGTNVSNIELIKFNNESFIYSNIFYNLYSWKE